MSGVNHVRIMGLKTIKKIRAYLLLYSPIYLTAYAASAFSKSTVHYKHNHGVKKFIESHLILI